LESNELGGIIAKYLHESRGFLMDTFMPIWQEQCISQHSLAAVNVHTKGILLKSHNPAT
jgi:hypothetical protein